MMYSTIDELPCLRSSSWSNGSIPGQGSLEKLLNPRLAKSSVMTGLRRVDSQAGVEVTGTGSEFQGRAVRGQTQR